MDRPRILVTDAQSRAALGAVRSLGRAGHTVIAGYALGSERPATGWSRFCSGELVYPPPEREQAAFGDWLCDQANRGTIDAVLPITETSLVGVAAVRHELAESVRPIIPSDSALRYTLSKYRSTRMAIDLGMKCPRTVFLSENSSLEKSRDQLEGLRFPIIIKTDNYFTPEGGYSSGRKAIATDPDRAHVILQNLEHLKTCILAQEFIFGTGVGAFLLRFNKTILLHFAHRRLHEVPYTGGASSFRESWRDDDLVRLGEKLLDSIDYDGVAMVEFRRSAGDGEAYFLEINGRLWGSLALALHCGVDFPAALVDCHLNGRPGRADRPAYFSGVRCRNVFPGEVNHLISVLTMTSSLQDEPRPSRLSAIARFVVLSFDPRVRHDYLWWSDPSPGLRQALRMVRWVVESAVRWRRGKLQAYSRRRVLKSCREEHERRCLQDQYFGGPLKQILFLCAGNICRSPFAAKYWNTCLRGASSMLPMAMSGGFHAQASRRSPDWIVDVAEEYSVDLRGHLSRIVTHDDVQMSDAVFVMDHDNYQRLITRFPWARDKTYFLGLFADDERSEVADPYDKGKHSARACYEQMVSSLEGVVKRISQR